MTETSETKLQMITRASLQFGFSVADEVTSPTAHHVMDLAKDPIVQGSLARSTTGYPKAKVRLTTIGAFLFVISLQLATALTPCWSADTAGDSKRTRVVCFGDSITKRGYPKILASLTGVESINAGVGGNSTAKALRRMDSDVLAKKPDAVVILFGTNDLRADADHAYVPVPQYISNLESMIAKCRLHEAKVILCTLPPIEHKAFFTRHERAPFEALGGLAKLIEDYRQAVIQVAQEHDVRLVDLNRLLALEPQWLSPDGVHPSEEGNVIIAKHIAKALVQKHQ